MNTYYKSPRQKNIQSGAVSFLPLKFIHVRAGDLLQILTPDKKTLKVVIEQWMINGATPAKSNDYILLPWNRQGYIWRNQAKVYIKTISKIVQS